jgi:light-regulated signal transduction histidine kinase (bacteriophytochrome)
MKPLLSKTEDRDALQTLGRASLQIVHDLKNQLNGLKLYATFLRRRMEKSDRPIDEQETVAKLMAGLERAAADLSTLVQFGRQVEVKKQPGVDLQKLMRGVVTGLSEHTSATGALAGQIALEPSLTPLVGEFDPIMLSDALKAISLGALKIRQHQDKEPVLNVRLQQNESDHAAIIEWLGLKSLDHDPFAAFAGSDEIRMSLAAKIISAHGGEASRVEGALRVSLPLN